MRDNKTSVPIAIVIAGVLIAGAIYFGDSAQTPERDPSGTPVINIDMDPVTSSDHIVGDIDAPVIIVEYSDTECPFCKNFHYTMKELVSEYDGQVAWVYRHFPIAQLHSRAPKEAEATECAAELGGNQSFWKYLDEIFERTNSNDSLDPAELPAIAGAIGLNTTDFNKCLNSGKYTQAIEESIEGAVRAGARGTPYSVIVSKDGDKLTVNGAEPIANIRAKVDSLLK